MKKITAVTQDANQEFSLTLDDGTIVRITSLVYVPSQLSWLYSLAYGNFALFNQRIVNSPNMLRKYRNIIPFGLCCTVIDGYEIINQSDFVSGRDSFYVLNDNDLVSTEQLITVTLPTFAGYQIS